MRNSQKSYQEYDYEKVEKKSKEFLKRIMGKEKFDKLQKDGKIEIEVNNKSDKIVYELCADGRVINKTKNQSYCIVADRSDYPIADMVAIKYAHLVYNNELAEKVANKTHLYTGITNRADGAHIPVAYGDFIRDMEQRGWTRQQHTINDTPWYGDYVDYMSGRGWHRELIILDQNNTNIASTFSINKESTGTAVDIRCPCGMKMSIMGRRQIPLGADPGIAYSFGLNINDDNGEEIPDDTKIRITKVKPSEAVVQLARLFYQDIKTQDRQISYKFVQGIEINGEEHITIHIINSPKDIPSENIKFGMEVDLWARGV